MEGFPRKPFNRPPNEEVVQQKTEIAAEVTESPSNSHPNISSVEIVGENRFNRMQELGASLAAGKELSAEDRAEYYNLHKEFITAAEGFDERLYGSPSETKNLISEMRVGENTDFVEHPAILAMGKERFNRLRELTEKRKNLTREETQEYLSLQSESHAAFLKYQHDYANTAPSSITFESPVEVYTENDVLGWESGAKKFKEFSDGIRDASMQEKFEAVFNPIDANALKALFLKEKPAVLLGAGFDPTDSYIAPVIESLKSFGIGVVGTYLYDKEQVQHVLETHKDIFKTFDSTDPDEVMSLIANGNIGTNHLAIGLLLGFPFKSVEKFKHGAEEQKEGGASKSQDVNVYGIQWKDFDDSLESKIRQARLKAAFEISGILSL